MILRLCRRKILLWKLRQSLSLFESLSMSVSVRLSPALCCSLHDQCNGVLGLAFEKNIVILSSKYVLPFLSLCCLLLDDIEL